MYLLKKRPVKVSQNIVKNVFNKTSQIHFMLFPTPLHHLINCNLLIVLRSKGPDTAPRGKYILFIVSE